VVTVDGSSKSFLEDELKGVMNLVIRAMDKEVKIAQKQIKRMKA